MNDGGGSKIGASGGKQCAPYLSQPHPLHCLCLPVLAAAYCHFNPMVAEAKLSVRNGASSPRQSSFSHSIGVLSNLKSIGHFWLPPTLWCPCPCRALIALYSLQTCGSQATLPPLKTAFQLAVLPNWQNLSSASRLLSAGLR